MSVPSRGRGGQRRHISVGRFVAHALGFAVLWAILSGGRGWSFGVPVILVATLASSLATPTNRWSLAGVAHFLPYFVWNSLRGGVDVAARALHPGLPIDPAVVRYEMQLDSTEARVLMMNTVTLLPGTLSADLQGNVLLVHVLNVSGLSMDTLRTLERRVRGLFRQGHEARAQ